MHTHTHTQNEARPELWGRYAMVLNKQQGLLRDSRLEVATPEAPGTSHPQHQPSTLGNLAEPDGGLIVDRDMHQQPALPFVTHEAQVQHTHHQHQSSSPTFMPLPLSATHLESRHVFPVHAASSIAQDLSGVSVLIVWLGMEKPLVTTITEEYDEEITYLLHLIFCCPSWYFILFPAALHGTSSCFLLPFMVLHLISADLHSTSSCFLLTFTVLHLVFCCPSWYSILFSAALHGA